MPIRDQKNLYKENRESFNLCSALIRLSSLALSQADPDRIVSQALRDIRKIFNAKICWLFLVEDNEIKFKSLGETRSTQNLIKSQLLPKLSPEILKRTYPIICNRVGELYKNNRALYKFLNGKRIHKFMGVPLKKDGKLVGALNLARDAASPSFTPEDLKSLTFLGNTIVMTKLRRTEEDSKKSQDFLEAIIDNIPNPIFIKDRKHRYMVLNKVVTDLTGYSRHKMLGKSDYDFFPKEQADFFWKKDEEMFRTGKVIDIPEEPITDKEGKIHYMHTKKAPLRDSSGRTTHLVGIIEDITERKRAESALRESEEKYRLLVENIKEGIYSTHKGVFTSVNESMSRMFGYSRKELIGMPSWNLAAPEIRNSVKDMFFEKAAKKDYSPTEFKCVRKDGSVFIAEVRLSRISEKQQFLGVVSDITERKRAEEALIRNERIARERARLLTDLRNLDRIDDILTRVCEAARDSGLFERAVMTLHDQVRQIVHLGQVGLPPDVVKRARQAPPMDRKMRSRITSKRFCISDSFFIPAEAGVDFSKTGRYVPQKRRKSVGGDWQPGDELFVPLRDFSGKIMGYLSVDTPADGCRPDVKTVQTLEMIVEAAASRVREVEAQEALKQERDFSQSILETANSMILCLDAEAKITVFNQECERVTGYRRKEVIGKRWPELFLPPDHHHFKLKSFANWVRAHPRDRYEGPIVTKSGEIRTILWSNTAILESDKKEIVAIAIGHDITERKRAEEQLRESEERYRSVVDNIGIGVSLISPEMEILSLNRQMKKWFPNIDVSKKPICYRAFNNPPREGVCSYCPTYKTLKDGQVHESITDTPAGDEIRNYRIVSSPIKDKEGKIIAAIEMVDDITERKRAVEALQRSERKYRTLVETAQEGIGIADPKENLIFINQAFADLLGYKKEELFGKNLKEICDETQYVMLRKETQKRKKGEFSKYEAKLLTKKGKPKYFYVSAAPLWNEDGSFMGTLAVLSDLTEIKKAREYNVLLNTSRELSRTLRLDQLLKIGAEKMIQVLNAERCAVLLTEDDTVGSMMAVQVYAQKTKVLAPPLKLKITEELFSSYKQSLLTQRYIQISDVRVDPVSALGRKILHKAGMLSSLIIPIFLGKTMLVVFHVGMTNKTRVFSSEEVRLVQTMANQVTVALQNCRLMEDLKKEHSRITEQAKALKKQTQEKDILLKVSRALSKTMDLDEVSEVASHVVGSVMGVERCAVTLATEDGNQLEIKGLFSKEQTDAHKLIGTKFWWGDIPAMTKAIKKGKPFVINDTSDVPSSRTREYFLKVGIKSVLGVGMFFGKKLVGILSITSIKEYKTFSREEVKLVQTMANQIAVAIENARLLQVVKKHTQNLRELSSQLMTVQENERKRIAQELHDEVGQMLQSMKMNLDRIKRNLSSKPRKLEGIEDWLLDTEKLLGQTIDDIRTLTFDLRPSMLDDFGLIPTLRWYVENYSRRSNIKVSLKTKDRRCRLPQDIEVTLYRIIQEALINVAKHAHATEATILVSKKDSTAVSSVRDNGVGFDAEKVLSHPKGMGLLNIKERVNLYGGSFEIISRPRKGTTLNINIPFKEVKHEEGQITGS